MLLGGSVQRCKHANFCQHVATLSSALLLAVPATASYASYVGGDLTAVGSVLVGGTGEKVSSHWLQIFPVKEHGPNETITVGVTEDAVLPGELIQIPQVKSGIYQEGVEITGDLIAKHGYADYGGNSHLIAYQDDDWVSDEVRCLYPGYIEDFPTDYDMDATAAQDYLGSLNLASFAIEQGCWNPASTAPFNVFEVHGLQ